MSEDFEQEQEDFIRRSSTPFSGYARADVPYYHPGSVRRGQAGIPAEKPARSWGISGVVVALILLFGAIPVVLTFDGLLRAAGLVVEVALPVLVIAAVVVLRRRNRRRLEEMD